MDKIAHCRIHNSPPLIPIQSQANPVHTHPSNFTEIFFLIVEELETNLMSLAMFYFIYYALNIFRTLIYPTSSRSLNVRFQEHIRYIRNNNPQSAYAQHILQNQHEYIQMNSIITLLKPLNNPNLLIPYEQYYIQTLY